MEASLSPSSQPSRVEIRPGRRIHVEVCDVPTESSSPPASSPPRATVLLVHGSCGHAGQWDAQVAWLNQKQPKGGLRIVRYDYLGCGQSEKPRENATQAYSASEHYRDLVAVRDRYCCASSQELWVLAHSFGCSLALRLASETIGSTTTPTITRLVLVAPAPLRFHESIPRIVTHTPLVALGWIQPVLTNGFLAGAFHPNTVRDRPGLVAAERDASNANPPYMFRAFYQSMAGYHATEASEAARAGWFQTIRNAPSLERVLIVCGAGDQIVPERAAAELREHLGGGSSCDVAVVEDAGHQVCQEQPERVHALLGAYLWGGGDSSNS